MDTVFSGGSWHGSAQRSDWMRSGMPPLQGSYPAGGTVGRRGRGWEAATLAIVLGVALLLRVYQLSTLPSGLHGDEAVAGLEAQRILRDGYIGPYTPRALGFPAGPLYLTALS